MKKTLLSLFTILGLAMTSQTLTQANHAPTVGENYTTYQCDSTNVLSTVLSSTSSWNFSGITTHSSVVNNYSTNSSSDAVYLPADISVSSATNNISYYKSTLTDLKYYGGFLTASGQSIQLIFSSPAVYAVYPMSFGTSTTSNTSGNLNTAFGNGSFTGNCSATYDAKGTLTLTSKTFTDIVRVHTTQMINGTLGTAPFTFTASVVIDNYDFYSVSASNYPILSISSSTLNSLAGLSSQTFVTIQKDYDIVSINENKIENIQLSVFPNPTINSINFTTTSTEATKVVAYDISGKLMSAELIESGKAKMTTSNFISGLYMYQVVGKYNQILTTGKFTVSK